MGDSKTTLMIVCDRCGEFVEVSPFDPLQSPWRSFRLSEASGELHACCGLCEEEERKRMGVGGETKEIQEESQPKHERLLS